ncbi:hypothetical protein [Synechococcus sp. CC9605]|uniref:hypothetical protein n=1 Tax=Synechococcus sp. (strain CC9605) TaxID=110662 RepID=UPI00059CEADF|nr:hypothetical protein [Synechococcus sp. CC9605]
MLIPSFELFKCSELGLQFLQSTGIQLVQSHLFDHLIIQQKPYAVSDNVGISLKVLGVQVLEIKTQDSAQGNRDPYAFGDDHLSQDDLGALFKKAA